MQFSSAARETIVDARILQRNELVDGIRILYTGDLLVEVYFAQINNDITNCGVFN